MGNRAVITTKENFENNGVGVYLHWNGGRDSVEAFLGYCKKKGYRPPSQDCYGWARLVQVIANFFGGSTSIGIDVVNNLDCDNWDNGVYLIDGWDIVGREYFDGIEQDEYDMAEMMIGIDECQPVNEQLGDYLKGVPCKVEDIQIGDKVAYMHWSGSIEYATINEFGEDMVCNGTNVKGLPYTGKYPKDNINAYIKNDTEGLVKIIDKEGD